MYLILKLYGIKNLSWCMNQMLYMNRTKDDMADKKTFKSQIPVYTFL